ncbi:MAG TPA: 3-keto-5-aminohexanoate cleavage protein [Streptosporangiaceae bacterium]|nr:3-keto-5-aminohexanoate cleavage protein [Streptosporangiaceae bacterium]
MDTAPKPIRTLKVCLNGRRDRAGHPAVPVTPAELAREAAAAVGAGAEAVHLHARGPGGAESVHAADVGAAVAAVRQACPGTPVGVSTGLWITGGDPAARQAGVASWVGLAAAGRPDFASVNVSEDGWAEVARTLARAGIGIEAGVWSVADAGQLAATAGLPPLLRVMVEVTGAPAATAAAQGREIVHSVQSSARRAYPLLLHGEDGGCWPLIELAGQLGLATRIGFEDTTTGPAGQPVTGNADLVRLALAILQP